MWFAKGHGTGNDFVILADPDGGQELTASLTARLCDRRTGIGGDGVLRAVRAELVPDLAGAAPVAGAGGVAAEWFMDYRNSDGSVAEMCGNGLRVFARYLAGHGLARAPEFTVATRSGARRVRLAGDDVTVEMGPVTVHGPGRAVVGGVPCRGLRISVGNPHLACLTDRALEGYDLSGPPELDPAEFPDGANVELVRVTGDGAVAMRVRERGAGETLSCGTGAVAAAAAARREGKDLPQWRVSVPGGDLTVTLEADNSWLTGPAEIVAEGDLDAAWLAAALR